jgi:hypothetical protein
VVVHNVCGFSVREMLHVSLLAHRIFMWVLDFWKICKPLAIGHVICMYTICTYKSMFILRTFIRGLMYSFCYRYLYRYVYAHCFLGVLSHLLQSVKGLYRCQLEIFDDADLCLAPFGLAQSNLVCRGHFDTGYANLRQVTYLSTKFNEKSSLAF